VEKKKNLVAHKCPGSDSRQIALLLPPTLIQNADAGRICSQLTSVSHSLGSRLLNLSLAYASLIVRVEPVTRPWRILGADV